MMNKLVLALVGLVAVAQADYLSTVGQNIGDMNLGFCLAFQDD